VSGNLPRLFTPAEVVAATGLSRSTVYAMIDRKELPAFRPPKTRIVRISEPDFLAFLEKFTSR
jgi:excisionase family DNA binding protein